jgi:hypothetical protein
VQLVRLDQIFGLSPGAIDLLVEQLDRVKRQIRAVIEAINDGLRTPGMKEELFVLEARKRELAAEVKQAPAPRPRLHPKLADLYRQRVNRLHDAGNRAACDLAGILALGAGDKQPATGDRDGPQ